MTPDSSRVSAYYDDFARHLLADYVYGNERIEAAIDFVVRSIPPTAAGILDIGCGIGWTTSELQRHFTAASVHGVDLSLEAISIASKLFAAEGIDFDSADVTDSNWRLDARYDAVVLCDVYEHIPDSERPRFDQTVSELLADSGMVALTFPSAQHQQFLAEHHPDLFQPVDETITEATIANLARRIGGSVVSYRPVQIWKPGDYVHAVVARPGYSPVRNRPELALERQSERSLRVQTRLSLRVTPAGALLPQRPGRGSLVIAPYVDRDTDAFVRSHMESLPGRVSAIFGVGLGAEDDVGDPLIPRAWRLLARVGKRVPRMQWIYDWITTSWFRKFTAARGISVALVEYGTVAAEYLDTLTRTHLPFVVHFHGYDAYQEAVLTSLQEDYLRLFEESAAVVVVSEPMRRKLMDMGAPAAKVVHIPCGAEVQMFRGGSPGRQAPLFIAAGRFIEKKAPHLTLLAFSQVVAKVPEARLLMIGDGPLLGPCRQLARGLRIEAAVEFRGHTAHRDVALAMITGRAFVQHSMRASDGDSEGTPVVILEAGAAGLPVVATRHGGIPEVVSDGVTGFLVDEGDVSAMATRMIELALDSALAARLGDAAAEFVRANHTAELAAKRLGAVLEDAGSGASRTT